MVIECPQGKVKAVKIVTQPLGAMDGLVSVPVIKVSFAAGEIDPFRLYYDAARQSRVQAPHHLFANISGPEALAPFFQRCGFPHYEGGDLLVAEVLIAAKRLRLLMEAQSALANGKLSLTRECLGEAAFTLQYNSHWFYWPPPPVDQDARKPLRMHQNYLEQEHKTAVERAAEYRTREELFIRLLTMTRSAAGDLGQVEFAPEICMRTTTTDGNARRKAQGIELRWILRPVRFLGAEDQGDYDIAHEQPFVAAPYLLMFLLDLTSGNETRICADASCRRIFGVGRSNQLYCDAGCAHRAASRSYRRRNRETKTDTHPQRAT